MSLRSSVIPKMLPKDRTPLLFIILVMSLFDEMEFPALYIEIGVSQMYICNIKIKLPIHTGFSSWIIRIG